MNIQRVVVATVISLALSVRGLKKKSLSIDGAITAFFVGFIHTLCGYAFMAALAIFFFTSSWLTKYKGAEKSEIEASYKEGGQRTAIQVLANSGIATLLCLLHIFYVGDKQLPIDFSFENTEYLFSSLLTIAFVGHYACANGDTWSSELGILAKGMPILLTTCKRVPRGTNGAVSLLGLSASILAGFVVGVGFFVASLFTCEATAPYQWIVIPLATLCGFVGSLVDSLLGASLQYSGLDQKSKKVVEAPASGVKHISGINCLDNHQVNFLSIAITSALAPVVAYAIYRLVVFVTL